MCFHFFWWMKCRCEFMCLVVCAFARVVVCERGCLCTCLSLGVCCMRLFVSVPVCLRLCLCEHRFVVWCVCLAVCFVGVELCVCVRFCVFL